ncbi:aromatic compound dioxygenase [Fomitiporia mediterranea MF3/22]|uniref:Aromatic compound dioxygenase n=1 Tax=Fomitiporia mediterranea (strain MF3/22) TaxID=694068 RepID=R7SH84_FOMME|nr:aromatic compound dioxygenase [Fomitiporia mediterranea MF3/22]EJC97740.1 aromatic compound dioxygenase [Fomitiporia mediterranea MF3/22]
MFRLASLLVIPIAFACQVIAHGTPPSAAEMVQRRELNLLTGRSLQQRCGSALAKRKAKRMHRRAEAGLTTLNKRESNDSVCILTPEVTQGPYHILGELVRQNITQGQAGVPLELNVDFFDIDTCEPVPRVWVDGWQCNATGVYSGYEVASAASNNGSGSSFPPLPSPTGTGAYTDVDDPNNPMVIVKPGDNENFLRGIWQTDDNGELTMHSIVPGWYSGRSVHFHIKVYTEGNGSLADNGTFVAGSAVHTGQFFFADDFIEKVGNTTSYNTNPVERVYNNDDIWYNYQNAWGYTANMDIAFKDEDNITAGVVGSISLGLNLTFASPELTPYYWGGNSSDLSATETASAF